MPALVPAIPSYYHTQNPHLLTIVPPRASTPLSKSRPQQISPPPTIRDDHPDIPFQSHSPAPSPSHAPRSRPNKTSKNGLTSKRRAPAHPSPVLGKLCQPDGKPILACLFCRGRKIACRQPLPGSVAKSCKQVAFSSLIPPCLQLYYPANVDTDPSDVNSL